MRALRSVFVGWLAAAVCLGACDAGLAQDGVRIGVLTIRSGPAKPIGDDILAGIETATRMHGPVLGQPVELVVEEGTLLDDGGDQLSAKAAGTSAH